MKKAAVLAMVLVCMMQVCTITAASVRIEPLDGSRPIVVAGVELFGEADGHASTSINTATFHDGWKTMSSGSASAKILVLNGVAVEGGRMSSDVTWTDAKVHVVRQNVIVPRGHALTLEKDCVVKFLPAARIIVEAGGNLVAKGALLADFADDSVAGDTNLDGAGSVPSGEDWWNAEAMVKSLHRIILSDGMAHVYTDKPVFTITFDANGGTGGWTKTMTVGATLTAPTVTKVGCTFAGWSPAVPATVPASDATYTAQWTPSVVELNINKAGVLTGFEGPCPEELEIPSGVTSIGEGAFYGCSGLTSVTIPDGVTNIGEHAFAACDKLQSLVFPSSVKSIGFGAVSYCESLGRIALPENLETIDDFAFYGNSALTAVYIPSSVKEIGMGAFAYCDSLASIDVADGNAEYASANGMLYTKDKKTLLLVPGGMREMLVPSGVESIGTSAAEGCFNLEVATLPTSVIEIEAFAFAYCRKLSRLRIPDQVRAIGDSAFLQCGAMGDIALPASLTTLGDGVFAGCTNIVSLTVAESNTNFMVLDDILYGQDLSTLYYALNSVRKVHVPEGVKLIASDAFVFCKELQDVVLPSSLNRIASEAFGDCDALGSIRIPKEVSEIGEYAFYECDNLTNVCFEGNAPSVGDHAFDEIAPTCVVHVRRDSTGWGVEMPGTWNGLRIEYSDGDGPEEVYELYETVVGHAPTVAASEYNGYLVDAKGNVKGTIQVKVGKPGKKDGKASVKATVVVGAKKVTLNAADKGKAVLRADDPTTVALVGKGAEACEITIGAEGLSGTYGAYVIDGARNFFTSKDKVEQIEANKLADGLIGSYNLVWSGGVASVTIAKKGKAKVSATLADGKKVTANASLLVGEEWLCVPVAAPKANLSFVVWLPAVAGRAPHVAGLGDDAVIGKPGKLAAGAKFGIDKSAALWAKLGGEALTAYLPDGVSVGLVGTKWVVANGAKAGKLTMKNGVLDDSKAGKNPSGLKLNYSAKDGSFKGSFKAYAVVGGKLKATTVNVSGVMIGSKGYGSASIKKLGSCSVTIELE